MYRSKSLRSNIRFHSQSSSIYPALKLGHSLMEGSGRDKQDFIGLAMVKMGPDTSKNLL
jgi:hypothetical protein